MKDKIGYRPTWAEINLNNLVYNFKEIKKFLNPDTKIMVTVKADAYGHGIIRIAKKLVECGVDYLGVASIDEGISLREAGMKIPILVLGMVLKKDIPALFEYNLTTTLCSEDLAEALNNMAKLKNKSINVHIKIDTGMGRLGVLYKDAEKFVKKVKRLSFINIEGIFTHFPLADTDRNFTLSQINQFISLIKNLEKQSIYIPLKHAANSIGIIEYPLSHLNMVRPGLIIYGLYPKKNINIKLKPLLSLKTKIVYFKRVPKGYGISYGHDYITKKETTIVVLPIGYGDGYPRNLSNLAPVLIKGRRFKISGRICMDQIMVDIGDLPVRLNEEVVLIGKQGKSNITVEELALLSGTIPYEIVCGLGNRITRIYID
ncbi:MAG: alanine racemase [Candidatus Omnitrophica bacterium]|nr:alanine racemase [Candidatus Omnitrophota bacterium]